MNQNGYVNLQMIRYKIEKIELTHKKFNKDYMILDKHMKI